MKPTLLDQAIEALRIARETSYAMEAKMKQLAEQGTPLPDGCDWSRLWNKPNSSGFSAHDRMATLSMLRASPTKKA